MQGAPLDWASEHRYHHIHCETPLEPHSIYEGFYWAHIGWLLDSEKKEERCADMSNAIDMSKQKFYQITSKYYKAFVPRDPIGHSSMQSVEWLGSRGVLS